MIIIPTISELYTQIKSDLEASFGDTIPSFGKNFLGIFAGVQAAKLWLYYQGIGFLQKNIFVDTADPEESGGTLQRFGRIKLNRNPFPAVAGQYDVTVTGTVGATVKAKTTFKSNDDSQSPGKLYIIDNDHVMVTSSDTISLRALETGVDSRLDDGDQLTATIPIANINKVVTVTAETIEPQAAEDIEDYRDKAIDAYRSEPQGGAGTDYRLWASDAQGVKQTYPYAKSGFPGEINLYVEATEIDSIDGKGTPSGALLTAVEEVVEFDPDTTLPTSDRGRRPLGVLQVHAVAISPKDVDIEIQDFDGLTADIQTEIENALELLLQDIRPYIASVDLLADKNDVININKIISTILEAVPGSNFGDVLLEVDGNPVSSYTFVNGNIPYLNSVAFT